MKIAAAVTHRAPLYFQPIERQPEASDKRLMAKCRRAVRLLRNRKDRVKGERCI
jgi:hypothetical protein